VSRRVVINQGPGVAPIQRVTGTRLTPRPVRELVRQTPVPETLRRHEVQPSTERPRVDQQKAPAQTGREQPRLYREAPNTQPPPTGRQEPRIYREGPNAPSAPETRRAPLQPPAQSVTPAPSAPPAVPREQPLPPPGLEKGRGEGQVRRREKEPAPRVAPAPPAPVAPAAPQPTPGRGKDRDRDGE
jgi:hypothetical protein